VTGVPNLLPFDGEVRYLGPVLSPAMADDAEAMLRAEVPWARDELVMFGRRVVTAREVAWHGDAGLSYRYSGVTKHPHPWFPGLEALRSLVASLAGTRFNSCLLNLYHDGSQGMGWHSDDESEIVPESCIASLSLGAARKFVFRHKRSRDQVRIVLEHGGLLLMRGPTQTHWHHTLPKSKSVTQERINLTFRLMSPSSGIEATVPANTF